MAERENEGAASPPPGRKYPVVDFRTQMKHRFWWRVAGLVVGVYGLVIYTEITFKTYAYSTDYLAAALGGTISILLMSGVLPMLWFAIFRKFDYKWHTGAIIVWYVLAVGIWAMGYSTNSFHSCLESRPVEECLSR